MADFSFWDWVWWSLGFIVLPVTWFIWSQWQSHKTYGEMRERIARIGNPWTCPVCPHPEHPMICLECDCDMMTNDQPAAATARDDAGEG